MHIILHKFNIEATQKDVFDAVSLPEHLINWWPLKCTGIPKKGETYYFNFTEKYDWFGTVVQCETPNSFHIKMTQADPDWAPTTFGFDLIEKDGMTNVEFSHKDWEAQNDHFRIASFCWAMLLKGLKDYVEKGEIISFEERS